MDNDVVLNLDWEIVYRIITEHLDDFRAFSRQVMQAIKV